jgi:hypothetical protein
MRTDGVEPPQPEAPRLQRGELSCAQRSQERKVIRRDSAPASRSRNHTLGPMSTARRYRLLPASATQGSIPKSNADRSSWLAPRAGSWRRAVGRIRTGTSRITTSDAAVTPRPPCADAGFSGFGSVTNRITRGIERREIIMAREAGRIFGRRAGTTGLEPARARLTSECSCR